MGSHHQTTVDLDATAEDAEALAEHTVAWLVAEEIVLAERADCRYGGRPAYLPGARWSQVTDERRYLESDGLAVVTGRTVFFGPLGSDSSPICPRCAEAIAAERTRDPIRWAMDTWYRTGAAEVRCPACGHPAPLPEWAWEHNCFAFAYLGFEFWNGPRLRCEFIAELGRVLGHRTRVVEGKI